MSPTSLRTKSSSVSTRFRLLAALVLSTGLSVMGLASSSPAQASPTAPCVAILTPTIGAFSAGNTVLFGEVAAAPGLVSGAVLGPLSQVPGITEASSTLSKVFPEFDAIANQISAEGASGLSEFRQSIGPLASANPALDALIALGANGLSTAATSFGTSIAPFNGTLAQLAKTIAFFSSSSCS